MAERGFHRTLPSPFLSPCRKQPQQPSPRARRTASTSSERKRSGTSPDGSPCHPSGEPRSPYNHALSPAKESGCQT